MQGNQTLSIGKRVARAEVAKEVTRRAGTASMLTRFEVVWISELGSNATVVP